MSKWKTSVSSLEASIFLALLKMIPMIRHAFIFLLVSKISLILKASCHKLKYYALLWNQVEIRRISTELRF